MRRQTAPGGGAWIEPALAGAVLGPALQLQQAALWPVVDYAALVVAGLVLGALVGWIRVPRAARMPAVALAAALLAAGATGWRAQAFQATALAPALEGRDLSVTGIVAVLPQRNEAGIRFRLDVESAFAGNEPVAVPPRLALGWYDGATGSPEAGFSLQRASAQLQPGERWQLAVRLKAPHGHLNPHGFDYELWLWEQGVQATGYVRASPRDPPPRRLAATWQHPVEQARHAARARIFERVADRQAAGILAALAVGDQAAIERADWDVFRATGVAHLMSISGLHITMFAWAAALALRALWRRSSRLCLAVPAVHASLVGGLLLATGYALFSGWGVPAQRTVLMLAAATLLRLAGLRWPWPATWLLVCAAVVTADPWALTQPGFWLSFVAVGILFASGRPQRDAALQVTAALAAARAAASLWREQWLVTVALAPLSLMLFGQLSLVGLGANLLAIPWVTLLVTPLALAGLLVPPAWDLAAWAVQALAWLLRWLAQVPGASVSVAAAPLWAGLAGVAGGLLLALPWPRAVRALGVPLMLPVLLWQPPRPATGEFELLAADVGQGNAVIVRTAGHTLVYDAGPRYSRESDAGHRVLVPLLRALGERVDTLVVSHRDADHAGGAAAVLASQPRTTLLSSVEPQHELQLLRPATRCEAGQRWSWEGVHFEVLHPGPGDYAEGARPNALSCVLRIANGRRVALLAGDIEQAQEQQLSRASVALAADLLLVPHHGSRTSSSDTFLDAVQPQLALVQAGYRNRFGHPSPAVLERYAARGIPVVTTARCGAATWRSADAALGCQRQLSPRYWHHQVP